MYNYGKNKFNNGLNWIQGKGKAINNFDVKKINNGLNWAYNKGKQAWNFLVRRQDDIMFWEDVRRDIDGLDKSFEKDYAKFEEYGDVKGLCELKDFMVSIRNSNILIEFDELAHYMMDDDEFKRSLPTRSGVDNEFYLLGKKILANSFIPIYFESVHGFVALEAMEALLMIVQFNYYYYTKKKCSRYVAYEKAFESDFIQYLSFFTDDYKFLPELPDFDESFFRNLKNTSFEDERARLLEDFLRCGYFSSITIEQDITWRFFNNIKFAARYLMACNALKRGSLKMNCEDVVVGFTLALKLITEDIRQYVRAVFHKKR